MNTVRLANFSETAGILVFCLVVGLWVVLIKGFIDIAEKKRSPYSAAVVLTGLFYTVGFALLHFQLTDYAAFFINAFEFTFRVLLASLYLAGAGGAIGSFQVLVNYFKDEEDGEDVIKTCIFGAILVALAVFVLGYCNLTSDQIVRFLFPAYKIR